MRNCRYEVGRRVLIRTPKGVFYGRIINVVPNTSENRLKFYKISGFGTPEEWLMEAIKLHGRLPRYIVIVQII